MAVLDSLRGIEVTVCINGQPAQEYEDNHEETSNPFGPNTVIKYIEAISDAEFSFGTTVSTFPPVCTKHRQKGTHGLNFWVKVDGKNAANHIWRTNDPMPWIKHLKGIYGLNGCGEQTVSPFKFAPVTTVEISDEAQIKKDIKEAMELGTLLIEVHRIKITGDSTPPRESPILAPAASEIAEKAVKGRTLSHSTGFGAMEKAAPRNNCQCIYPDGGHPVARFVFRYRSREALQKLMIIPRSPTPDPFDALSREERDRLARGAFERLRQSSDDKQQIKLEQRIKREREGSPKRGPDVVDLTDDASAENMRKKVCRPIDLTDD